MQKAEDGLEALIGPFRLKKTVRDALQRGMLMPFTVSVQKGKGVARLERGQNMREASVNSSSSVSSNTLYLGSAFDAAMTCCARTASDSRFRPNRYWCKMRTTGAGGGGQTGEREKPRDMFS